MNKTILTAVLAFVLATLAVAKTNISVTTSKTQLVMQVKDNGRLYQTYLGARLHRRLLRTSNGNPPCRW